MKTTNLEYSVETMREAMRDVSYILTEIESGQDQEASASLARCAYARLQQIERDYNA